MFPSILEVKAIPEVITISDSEDECQSRLSPCPSLNKRVNRDILFTLAKYDKNGRIISYPKERCPEFFSDSDSTESQDGSDDEDKKLENLFLPLPSCETIPSDATYGYKRPEVNSSCSSESSKPPAPPRFLAPMGYYSRPTASTVESEPLSETESESDELTAALFTSGRKRLLHRLTRSNKKVRKPLEEDDAINDVIYLSSDSD